MQCSTYDTFREMGSNGGALDKAFQKIAQHNKSTKSLISSETSEDIIYELSYRVEDFSELSCSAKDSPYRMNAGSSHDSTQKYAVNIDNFYEDKILDKTMKTIAEVSDENYSSKEHSKLAQPMNARSSENCNPSHKKSGVNMPYPYTCKPKLFQHCQKVQNKHASLYKIQHKCIISDEQKEKLFNGNKEFEGIVRPSDLESSSESEQKYFYTNEDYNPMSETGTITGIERGQIFFSKEDFDLNHEVLVTNSNDYLGASSYNEDFSSPSQIINKAVLRTETEHSPRG